MRDLDAATTREIWRGQLVDNGPIRVIVEDKRGQYLLPTDEKPPEAAQEAISGQIVPPKVRKLANAFDALWGGKTEATKPIARRRIQT